VAMSKTTESLKPNARPAWPTYKEKEIAMEVKTYTTIDRAALGWPAGPWDGEPDKVQWPDDATGLPCLAVRHTNSGHWCGYVGVAETHPWYCKGYSDVDVAAHGGLTFADKCQPGKDETRGVCHIPAPGEPDHVWWFGFDCAHSGDRSPRDEMYATTRGYPFTAHRDETYKTLAYVQRECAELAAQVVAVGAA
jgi:hypothetical protein